MTAVAQAGFPPRARLRDPREFEAVLAQGSRLHEKLLTAVVRPNDLREARLGLAISARAVPTAVARNRVKRAVRESFRHARAALPALDIVVLARNGAGAASRGELHGALERLWQRARSR